MRMNHAVAQHIGGTAVRSGPVIAVVLGLAAAAPVEPAVQRGGGSGVRLERPLLRTRCRH
jgi:hypothetical protein